MKKIGIDIGGTFTDLVYTDGASSHTLKLPSTPLDPGAAAIDGLRRLRDEHGADLSAIDAFAHGTTVATNAVIQRRGAKTALITTAGFRDVLEIARLGRPPEAIYDVHYQPIEPVIPRRLRFEVSERVNYRGEVTRALDADEVRALASTLRTLEVESIAVSLLFSFLHPAHEQRVKELLEHALPGIPVLCSSDILPERREYERTSTTAISAYLAPIVTRYIDQMMGELQAFDIGEQLYIMQSNGGLNTPQAATANPGRLLLSGPAAGIVAAARLGVQAGFRPPHLDGHGRYQLRRGIGPGRSLPARGRDAAAGSRLQSTDARHSHHRCRWRQPRVAGHRRQVARRPAERRRIARPRLLRPGRARRPRSPTQTWSSAGSIRRSFSAGRCRYAPS